MPPRGSDIPRVAPVSFWFDALDQRPAARPALPSARDADVCIVGAGFTGLWTAYELLKADPALDVVVLEREFAGFGASGRNGGWVVGEPVGSRASWAARSSAGELRRFELALRETVDEIGGVAAAEGIECDYKRAGSLQIAQTPLELQRVHERLADERVWGIEDTVLLGAAELEERVRVRGGLGAHFTPHCARVQPAKLAIGLAAAVERLGATIYEYTPVTDILAGRVSTPRGDVRAKWVVQATEGYGAGLPGRRRDVVPITSAMIVTEPLPDDAWERLGWDRAETLQDGRRMYCYLQRTADGRIAIGGRSAPYRYASQGHRERRVGREISRRLDARLRRLFGDLHEVRIEAAWQGVLGFARTWAPAVGVDRATGRAWAHGYAGDGVAAANLAGRTLTDLMLGRHSELTTLPWVGPLGRRWEPEPLRFVGIRAVYGLLGLADKLESRTGRSSRFATAANRLTGQT
jgi:glycine/D-amino acid oxidase-like deaminating enzyme